MKVTKNEKEIELCWHGKDADSEFCKKINSKYTNPFDIHHYLVKNKSVNCNNTDNIYIEGDNLEALNLLQKYYKNKIRVIYIDPPYNTGKDFTYNDKFRHSDWCSMIYFRLKLARELMSEDGVIFISIDDNEVCNLKSICGEVFGEENFITQFIYEKTQHFGRQKLNTYSNERVNTELVDAPLYNASNNLSTLTFPSGIVKFNIKDGTYSCASDQKYELLNEVIVENGKNKNQFSLKFKSRWSQKKVHDEIKKGTSFWIKSENFAIRAVYSDNRSAKTAPKQIIFTNKNNKFCTTSRFGKQVTTNETASKELKELIGDAQFSYPKPVSLISYLLSLIFDYKNDRFDDDFIVLDFFSGSATTAHAVMELNAIDGGKRKFILIQHPESLDKNSVAYKLGYKTLCDIGEERIKQASKKIKNDYQGADFDCGFRVYKIDD